jgi:carbon monoxide dehydrogenase subunit G
VTTGKGYFQRSRIGFFGWPRGEIGSTRAVATIPVVADTFSHSTQLNVSRSQVWAWLQDPELWGSVAGVDTIQDVRFNEDGTLAGYAFTVKAGIHTIRGTADTVEGEPNARMKIEIVSPEMAGWIEATLEGQDESPTVTVELSMQPKGILANMFYPVIAQTVGREFPAHVQVFADRLNQRATG